MHKTCAFFCALFVLLSALPARAVDMSSVKTVAKPVAGGKPWSSAQVAALKRFIEDHILSAPTLRGALIGLEIVDTARGQVLFAKKANADFMPASTFKLLVGSTALRKLGLGFSFETTIDAQSAPKDGVISGNLYLRGGGDALLSAKDLDAAAASLASSGVREIDGAIVTDVSHFDTQRYGFGWSWDDLPYYYAPVVSALELEDGVVHVTVTPASRAGAPVTLNVWPQSSAFTIQNQATTGFAGTPDTTDIARPWDQPHTIAITGSYPLGAKTSDDLAPAVPDPPSYAGDVLLRALQAHGITVSGTVEPGTAPHDAVTLWTHRGDAMPQLLADLWYPSDNLIGELLLKELGVAQGGEPGTDANGIRAEQQFLRSIGVDPATVAITDGSGMSHYDHITPFAFVKILQADWNSPYRNVILDALPVPGVRGTMQYAYLHTTVAGNTFLKDGVIANVRTLCGYVKTRTHGPLTVSFLINSWMGDGTPAGAADMVRLRTALLSYMIGQ